MAEHTGEVRRAHGWGLLAGVAVVMTLLFGGVAAVATGVIGPAKTSDTTTLVDVPPVPSESPSATPGKDRQDPPPVNPWCWSTKDAAENVLQCQDEVKNGTKFPARYMTNQSTLARTHPVVKLASEGRPWNSLARHGLLICWMTTQPEFDIKDMRAAFYMWFHRHQFKLPGDDVDGAADNILSIAVQEICPSQAQAYEDAGGPNSKLITG